MTRHALRPLLTLALVPIAAATLWGYAFVKSGTKWPNGTITIHEQLSQTGGNSGTLTDGSTSWDTAFEAALAIWNPNIARVQFAAVRGSSAAIGDPNNINNIIFSSTNFGSAFGAGTLAVTTTWSIVSTATTVETDMVFNTAFPWDSYRGNLKPGNIQDLRRVALHEVGHILGLDHPDDYGQQVQAVMNSHVSNIDSLQPDDIAGAQAIYGGPPGVVNNGTVVFPPRNEVLDWENQLDNFYATVFGRPAQTQFFNIEGQAVWDTDYLRYRVNLCNHIIAVNNVLTQIHGNPAPSVCGNAPPGQQNFPPRNESLAAHTTFETEYRDVLHAAPVSTHVDVEGSSVWLQEYLRYRVNGCNHGDAAAKVLQQLRGGGIAPVCNAPAPPPAPGPTPAPTPPPAPTTTVLTVIEDPGCLGIVQSSGLDVFIDGNLVGVVNIGAPFVITLPVGTHTIRARYNQGFLPTTTINLTTATATFTILCG